MMSGADQSLTIGALRAAFRAGWLTPRQLMQQVLDRIDAAPARNAWITRLDRDHVMRFVAAIERRSPDELPLYGVPFAIKDNIDLADVATTAACPEFAYVPPRSAYVVEKLIAAGAIPVGKTNLDQFATGLVGARSPYGAGQNPFDASFISGGSSAGSAITVAQGLVSFALGTDTAGSGRVPAAFCNLIGLKPTRGLLSNTGVVPACRSLDCVSIFALSSADAARVLAVAEGFDPNDPYSRMSVRSPAPAGALPEVGVRVGVPKRSQLEFFGDEAYARLFDQACARANDLGATLVEVDLEPFLATARLLYEGPWVAERYAAIETFIDARSEALHPVTREIIAAGAKSKAVDAFKGQYELMALRRVAERVWKDVDVIITPTAGTIYPIAQVEADPVRLNANLGYYTNFMNLLDLAAVAVPAGFRDDELPFGVTLFAPAFSDLGLLRWADRLHRSLDTRLGATPWRLDQDSPPAKPTEGQIAVAVCGAHMQGLPLNHQLTERGGHLLSRTRTAPVYRFYALSGGPPYRPGLVRVDHGGTSVEVEVWSVPEAHFGSFVAGIPAPLGIGKVELEDGNVVPGFVCESYAIDAAEDITALGSWRDYLARAN